MVGFGKLTLFQRFIGPGCALALVQLAFRAEPRTGSADRASEGPIQPRVLQERLEPHWFAGGDKFWYRRELPHDGHEFILVDAVAGTRAPAFDHAQVAKALSRKLGRPVAPDRLPIGEIQFADEAKTLLLFGTNAAWAYNLHDSQLTNREPPRETEKPPARKPPFRRSRQRDNRSPDGKWEALVRGDHLFLRETATDHVLPLSYDGNPTDSYARGVQRQQFVEMEYDAVAPDRPQPDVLWSPDSKWLVAMRTRQGTARRVFLINSSPSDQLQPKLESYPYAKPGDDIAVSWPHLFEAGTRREVPIERLLFPRPWSISDLRWNGDSAGFTFLYNQRGHQALRILEVKAATGAVRPIINEESQTFIDYSGKFFCQYLDSGEIIWMSERDGWNHLYLFDKKTGRMKAQITRGPWVVRGVDWIEEKNRQIWFRAGGIRPAQDPYYIHYARIGFDGTGLTVLTEADGTHQAQFSPDRRFFIDTWSRVDLPPGHELRRSRDGQLLCQLEQADATDLLANGWRPPERFSAKGRDGSTDIYGVIFWPKDFDPNKKYPVIENIYAGPQGSYVPKSFRSKYAQQRLAARGFVVVQIDGMGTSHRSKKFHDVCWKNLGDAGFPDRILWIKAAAAKYPAIDLGRVGIYGTSAGGQNALRGLLAHGDFYKAGVADSGCHDNRMDKIWWNEQWMGWPVGPHYAEQSNVTQAHELEGKLLLMVGELDKNVDPSSTMQVVHALIEANKDFELLVMPGAGHGLLRTPYGWHRLEDFFVRTFLPAVTPHTVAFHDR